MADRALDPFFNANTPEELVEAEFAQPQFRRNPRLLFAPRQNMKSVITGIIAAAVF